ncbi:MAG: beta-galactosidase [Prolixibacteraceae bacterium]
MKQKVLLLSVFWLITMNVLAQKSEKFFSEDQLITVGAYYYPEHWSESQWDRDLGKMAEMGFEFTHMGEFAWAFMEPEEGKFDFAWLDKAVDIAAKKGLKVVLCTPTPCPPIWLSLAHPDIYRMDRSGKTLYHGSRGNYSTSSDLFWDYTEKIVSQLAMRYGNNKAVIGWQLDNEPNSPDDYSQNAQQKFQFWLKEKYKTIEHLNDVWGNRFWSCLYQSFDQIRIPDPSIQYGVSPGWLLDYDRFKADKQAEFLDFQAKVLRKYISKDQWITSNYIHSISASDPRRPKELDFSCYTMYPVSSEKNLGENGFRLGIYNNISFANDFYRPIKGTTGVMELQPGQVNWAGINPIPEPGAINMWLWNVFAGGSSFACTYRFRQPLYGSEQYHHGIIGTDGVTPSRGGLEYQQFITQIDQLRQQYKSDTELPAELLQKKTAILWSHDNLWDIDIQKRTKQWDTWGYVKSYYDILKSLGCPVDLITEKADFSAYNYLLVPAYQMVDEKLISRWNEFAEKGGQLIVTCRTGHKNRDGHLFEAQWAEPMYNLIGAKVDGYDLLLEDGNGLVSHKGIQYHWNNWGEQILPFSGTQSLASYDNQFYKGMTAVTNKKTMKGSVTYIGIDTDDKQLEKILLSEIYQKSGAKVQDYPKGVFVEWRDGFLVAVNYSSETYTMDLPANAKIIFGNKALTSPGVLVWTEKK